MLQRLLQRLVGSNAYPTMLSETSREKALDTLSKHCIDAHFYLPAAGCMDVELEAALRLLGSSGYLMTDATGSLVGHVGKARLTSDERARETRKRFFLVER
jgi:hypothetical protein